MNNTLSGYLLPLGTPGLSLGPLFFFCMYVNDIQLSSCLLMM